MTESFSHWHQAVRALNRVSNAPQAEGRLQNFGDPDIVLDSTVLTLGVYLKMHLER